MELAKGVEVETKKDKMMKTFLFQVFRRSPTESCKKKTTKEVWDYLTSRFVGTDLVKMAQFQTLKSNFEAMQRKEKKALDEYDGKLNVMSVKYSNFEYKLDNVEMVKKLFDTALDEYYSVIASIEQFFWIDTMAFEKAMRCLKMFEEHICMHAPCTNRDGQLLLT